MAGVVMAVVASAASKMVPLWMLMRFSFYEQ
jgi:hypothetical protein